MAAATAVMGESNTDTVESPSPIESMRRPPRRSTAVAMVLSCTTKAWDIATGCVSHRLVEATMSVKQNVSTPLGSELAHPARSRSTNPPGVAGRRAGSVARPSRMAASSWSTNSGSMPSHDGRIPVGGPPVSRAKAVAARE